MSDELGLTPCWEGAPEDVRTIVAARDVQGMSYAQAGALVGLPAGEAQSRVHLWLSVHRCSWCS